VILGIGTDLCDVGRIHRAIERHGERLAQRILVDRELSRYRTHVRPAHFLAKRFAAKEALSKALGTGIRAPVNWHNIEVRNAPSGRPFIEPSARLAALLEERGISSIHVSITDEHSMACAFVILEGHAR
jgi:holo-[acyl-carrier protein] synthase